MGVSQVVCGVRQTPVSGPLPRTLAQAREASGPRTSREAPRRRVARRARRARAPSRSGQSAWFLRQ